jgi:hypothetical protein
MVGWKKLTSHERAGFTGRTRADDRQTCDTSRTTGRLPAVPSAGRPRADARATDSAGTSSHRGSDTRASSHHVRWSGKPQGRRSSRRQVRTHASAGRRKMKRRSGIVRRPAAPDSASEAGKRCRGRKPQERRPIGAARRRLALCAGASRRPEWGRSCRTKAGLARSALR